MKNENFSTLSEEVALGSIIRSPFLFRDDIDPQAISPEDFYLPPHQEIFRAIVELLQEGREPNLPTLFSFLKSKQKLSGGLSLEFLKKLESSGSMANDVKGMLSEIRTLSIRRAVSLSVHELLQDLEKDPLSTKEVIEKASSKIHAISQKIHPGKSGHKRAFDETIELLKERSASLGKTHGASSGLLDLDRMTGGFAKGDLVILAARPSMGKTAMALGFILESLSQGIPCLMFTMEMSASQIVFRLLSQMTGIPLSQMMQGRVDDKDWEILLAAHQVLEASPLLIEDASYLSEGEIQMTARRAQNTFRDKGGLGLIVLDYLQLMSGTDEHENRATEISSISRALKGIAREHDLPVVALSQLNRAIERRIDKRPMMSDLRESGAIEQDADLILFIYRDEVYHPDKAENKGQVELIIGKQRNGPIGAVQLMFSGESIRFENAQRNY